MKNTLLAKSLEAHLPLLNNTINSRNNSHRAFPLSEIDMPIYNLRKINSRKDRTEAIYQTLDWLDVERTSRYFPDENKTFCNIYVHDLAYCLGCYIPRIWWHETEVERILNGKPAELIYGKTVFEQNSNSLFDWFIKYGFLFSWKRCTTIDELQRLANKGSLGIIVAQRHNPNHSGHITAVICEKQEFKAMRDVNGLVTPLQSQAGVKNKKFFIENWWNDDNKFRDYGFWILDI